jgi:beta-phosphoglucomutase
LKYHGLIFDFNGVLWWDSHLQEASWQIFAQSLTGRTMTAAELAQRMHGRTNQSLMEYLTGRPITGDELARLIQQKESVYRQMCLDQGPAFRLSPGAVELLDALAARAIPRTIATASERTNVDFFFEHLPLARWFDRSLVVLDDGRLPGKPAPDFYLAAAARLGPAPGRCVVVEDSDSGLAAARAAGIGYLIALGPPESHGRLVQIPGVHQVIASLAEVAADDLF